jgi:beta-galactosidase
MNQTVLFNHGWLFQKTPLHTTTVVQENFQPVEIPHDWLIYNSQALYEDSIGWYQKTLTVSDLAKSYLLYF